jgi:hypothetical protein
MGKKMEGSFSTGQSPQWAVVPVEEEQQQQMKAKTKIRRVLKKTWESKVMDGQFIGSIDKQRIGEEDTFMWRSSGYMEAGTESAITAA